MEFAWMVDAQASGKRGDDITGGAVIELDHATDGVERQGQEFFGLGAVEHPLIGQE